MGDAYAEYSRSEQWHRLRDWVKWRDGYVCQDCGSRDRLEVHHMTYARTDLTGTEPHTDLITLCARHHRLRTERWWTRVPGGGRNGRDFTFDYLGPQTEWRMQNWAGYAPGMQRVREEAWFADRWLQQEYANALAKAGLHALPGRPVRAAGRQLTPVAEPASFADALAAYLPLPRSPKPRRKARRRLKIAAAVLAVGALLAGVEAAQVAWPSPTSGGPTPTPTRSTSR